MVLVGPQIGPEDGAQGAYRARRAVAAIGIAASTLVADPMLKMIALSVGGFGIFAVLPVFWTMPTAFLSGAAAAGGIAIINSIGNLAGFVGPYVMGSIEGLHRQLYDRAAGYRRAGDPGDGDRIVAAARHRIGDAAGTAGIGGVGPERPVPPPGLRSWWCGGRRARPPGRRRRWTGCRRRTTRRPVSRQCARTSASDGISR